MATKVFDFTDSVSGNIAKTGVNYVASIGSANVKVYRQTSPSTKPTSRP